jgi:SAM-dependent methyltransferase
VVVSASHPDTAWQREGLVDEFLADRRRLLPLLELQEGLIERILARSGQVRRFLDIGAGAGAMSDLVLGVAPDAEAVLVDNSQPMLDAARRRLAGSARAWQSVQADLRDRDWAARLPHDSYDAAVSGYAIHHLPSQRKRELFAEVFALLAPGGVFVNLDVVLVHGPLAGLFDEQIIANAVQLERERGGPRSEQEIESQMLADQDDDRPDSAGDQLRWLAEAGYEEVELHFKWAEGAIFAGHRPKEGSA